MCSLRISKFMPNGPLQEGLQEWGPIDPSDLESGNPIQRGYLYSEDSNVGYMAGVWDCTAMTTKFEPYPVNEFMLLLDGSVTMIEGDGTETTINAGEPFIIPKGLPCQWKQDDYVSKYFVIFENPGVPAAQNVTEQGVILPYPADVVSGRRDHHYFSDTTDLFEIGVMDRASFSANIRQSEKNELFILLEGSATITDDLGGNIELNVGEALYVPKGAAYQWQSAENVRRLYCSYAPK